MKSRFLSVLAMAGLGTAPVFAQDDSGTEQFISPVSDEAMFEGGGGYTSTDGEELYNTFCAGCHMPAGEGASGAGEYPPLSGNPRLEFAAYPITIIVNGQGGMPGLGHLLSDEQVLEVTSYIQSDLGNDYAPDGTLQMVADTRPVEEGEVLAEHEVEEENVDPDREDMAEDGGGNETGVVRHRIPNSNFPILLAAEIPADATLVYLSGTVPQVVNPDAAEGSPERYGDTTAQTVSTLASIEQKLASIGLDMADVVKMQVYLVSPEGADAMDFAGFMEGYVRFFGTETQPELPTRSVFEVAGLANPSWLVEIEVVAVRP
ncbi:Rid family hydrolase [Aquicoccus porphyridii]|uniref:Rid family hydrolase n=1 Tax=Aquicoccus porphyridii TaxID=1852029 RepID=UPI002740021C|nr:Rid family hydrolase [Aquicoccus porphyridii]